MLHQTLRKAKQLVCERKFDCATIDLETHQALLGRAPRLVAADAAFYSAKNEAAAKAKGVKRVCIPNRSTKSSERKREQRKRWFRNGQKWRTGCEGRISVVKRRNGLDRCRYKGYVGMNRWSASASSPTTSSTSAAPWKSSPPLSRPDRRQVWQAPPVTPGGVCVSGIN
jgi:hypothetical protein